MVEKNSSMRQLIDFRLEKLNKLKVFIVCCREFFKLSL